MCPGNSERGRNPCRPGCWGWGRNPLGLEITTAPCLQLGARRPLLRTRTDPQSHCLPEAHRPTHLFGAAILLFGKLWSKSWIRILFIHFSEVSFFFVPACDSLPARTHRYPLVPGPLDFFFLLLFYRQPPRSKGLSLAVPDVSTARLPVPAAQRAAPEFPAMGTGESPAPAAVTLGRGGPRERTLLLSPSPEQGTSLTPGLISEISAPATGPGRNVSEEMETPPPS